MFFAVSVGRRRGDFHLIEHNTIYVIKIDRGIGVPRVPGVHGITGALVCQGVHGAFRVPGIPGSLESLGHEEFLGFLRFPGSRYNTFELEVTT